jgi:hypothetical protein
VIVLSMLGVVVIAAGVLVGAWFIHRGSSPCPVPTAQYSGTTKRDPADGVSVSGPAGWGRSGKNKLLTQFKETPDSVKWFEIGTAHNGEAQTSIHSEEESLSDRLRNPRTGDYTQVQPLHRPRFCNFHGASAVDFDYTGYKPGWLGPDALRRVRTWLWIRDHQVKQISLNEPQYLWDSKADALFAQLVRTAKDT